MSNMPKSEPKSEMGTRIAARMEELGLNAKQLSLSAGLNETYVRDLLKTESPNPRFYHLKALAQRLGVSVNWLDTGKEGAEVVEIWDRIPARNERRENARNGTLKQDKGA